MKDEEKLGVVLEEMWCNCGLDDPEPKWHSIDCTYRVVWEDTFDTVHMNSGQLKVAEEISGWKSTRAPKRYYPDYLDCILMERLEELNGYGPRDKRNKIHTGGVVW